MTRLTVGSLFSGIGGLELGLERTGGFETAWQVEIDDYATRVLERHWPGVRRWRDVTAFPPDAEEQPGIDVRRVARDTGQEEGDSRENSFQQLGGFGYETRDWYVDLICGGFPCQDISYAGKGAGLTGERSGLFYEAARVIRTLGPKYVLLENVAALLTRGLGDVLGTLASLGYDCWWNCLQAADVGAPHIRDRVFIIGRRVLADAECAERRTSGAGDCDVERQDGGLQRGREEDSGGSGIGGEDVADTESMGWSTRCGERGDEEGTGCGRSESASGDQDVPDSQHWIECIRTWKAGSKFQSKASEPQRSGRNGQWAIEPDVGRVAHGVPSRVDRLRCLGNAVVPQCAEFIGRMILDMEERDK